MVELHDWTPIMGPTFGFYGWTRTCLNCCQTQKVTMSGREAVGEHHTPAQLFEAFAPNEACEGGSTEIQRLSIKFMYNMLSSEETAAVAARLGARVPSRGESMSTILSDETTVNGTNRNEALLKSLRTGREIRQAGRRYWDTLTAQASALRQSHHERNGKARKHNRWTWVEDAGSQRV